MDGSGAWRGLDGRPRGRVASAVLLAAGLAACGTTSSMPDAGIDAAIDAGADAADAGGFDAGDGGVGDAGDAGVGDAGDAATPDGGACAIDASSTLSGVSIRFTGTECVFTLAEAAAGISIPYEVVVEHDVPGVDPMPDPHSISGDETPGPSGLHVFEYLSGGTTHYCLCDIGLPAPPTSGVVTLPTGTYPDAFSWDGRAWSGPSDTGMPEGAPFPVGSYDLLVRATGTVAAGGTTMPFDVHATLTIVLVP